MRRFAIVLFVMAAGCGGDDSEATPVEKCNNLVDTVCDRGVECVPDQGTHQECVDAINNSLSCDSAQSVSETYDSCMSKLRGNSCATLFPDDGSGPQLALPSECSGVIMLGRETAAPAAALPARLSDASGFTSAL